MSETLKWINSIGMLVSFPGINESKAARLYEAIDSHDLFRSPVSDRSVDGFRASIYNAMPEASVDALISVIKEYR